MKYNPFLHFRHCNIIPMYWHRVGISIKGELMRSGNTTVLFRCEHNNFKTHAYADYVGLIFLNETEFAWVYIILSINVFLYSKYVAEYVYGGMCIVRTYSISTWMHIWVCMHVYVIVCVGVGKCIRGYPPLWLYYLTWILRDIG